MPDAAGAAGSGPESADGRSALEFHPAAAIFDMLESAELDALVESIREGGLRLPIILHPDGRVLDGRNRYLACQAAGVEPRYETWDGEGLAADYVRDLNGPRRQASNLAAPDAVLYMWATAPKLKECLQVLEAWGFEYQTNFVWVKNDIGMDSQARSQHELLLVAQRGAILPSAAAARVSSVVHAPRGEQGGKPGAFYDLIESFYPSLPKVELFARSPREGWAAWGNQAKAED